MKKLEADVFQGIVAVGDFNAETRILSNAKSLTVEDFIDELSRPFDGVIGWNASDMDIKKILGAEYTIAGIKNRRMRK